MTGPVWATIIFSVLMIAAGIGMAAWGLWEDGRQVGRRSRDDEDSDTWE